MKLAGGPVKMTPKRGNKLGTLTGVRLRPGSRPRAECSCGCAVVERASIDVDRRTGRPWAGMPPCTDPHAAPAPRSTLISPGRGTKTRSSEAEDEADDDEEEEKT